MATLKTLVLGGYGNFGARICRALAGDAATRHHIALLVAGRDASRAQALANTLGHGAQGVALDHQAPGLAATLRKWGVDLVIHTAGPFQAQGYSVAQAAAIAALADEEFVARSYALNQAGMQQLTDGLRALELEYIPSYGNFLSFRVGDAARVYRRLLELGVIVRPIASYAMPEYLRVSIGLPAENARFLQALETIMQESA